MKRLSILISAVVLLFTGCTPDFDPQTDSDQRNATFRFETEHLFDDYLMMYDGDTWFGGGTIEEAQRIRISIFCYDTTGMLIDRAMIFVRHGESPKVTLRHLWKDTPYHFVFLADIVEYNNSTDFFEHWFHIGYKHIDGFYTRMIQMNEWDNGFGRGNLLWHLDTIMTIENQSYDITLNPITYNGYISFTETESITGFTVIVQYHGSLNVSPLSGRVLDGEGYENNESYLNGWGWFNSFVLPIIDSTINFTVFLTTDKGTETIHQSVPNPSTRPFTIFFNCQTKRIERYDLY